ncbi:hypothetical protein FHS42_001637 [Streptomyces zagrosensis]|uniref:Uncharacterized protein n=1 Tax=Streptomyces zagrosensis TaxID=1042984 RepID=A0A7W9UX51_9ACTN|nr:hypothetical protein [Streptomyces zagrosensis]
MVTLTTSDGGTVEITQCGALVDIHVRGAEGRTVATVTRRAGEAAALLNGWRTPRDPQTDGR